MNPSRRNEGTSSRVRKEKSPAAVLSLGNWGLPSSMPIVHDPDKIRTRPPRWPFLRCCAFADHLLLLGDLERDGIEDSDIANLLPRIRRLLSGQGDNSKTVPWWAA